MKILIGSGALHHHFPTFRKPKDLDYFSDVKKFDSQIIEGVVNELIPAPDWWIGNSEIALPEEILNIKASHLFWTRRKNHQHINDIEFLMSKGFQLYDRLYYKLIEHWREIHGPPVRPDFTKTPDQFFDDYVQRKLHHDEVHLIINSDPTFKKILVGNGTVEISEDLFKKLTFEEQLSVVREEVYVLSYERWNDKETTSPTLTYMRTLNHFISCLAPEWLTLFALKNYKELKKPLINYKTIIESYEK